MRILLIITCLANIAFAFGSLPWMPNPAAVHFGLGGIPDGFMVPITFARSVSYSVGMSTGVFICISLLMARTPSSLIYIPNRGYWLNKENRPKTLRRLCSFIELCGIVMMLFFLFMQWEIVQANQRVPPKLNGCIYLVFCTLPVFIAIAFVRLYLSFRLPKDKDNYIVKQQ